MESRTLGAVDGGKNPHAETETGDSSADAGPRIFSGFPEKIAYSWIFGGFWLAVNSEFGIAQKERNLSLSDKGVQIGTSRC